MAAKDAQVMGEGSGEVGEHSGEGSVEGKHRHVPHKESIEARKDAYVSEKGESSGGGRGGGWK